jgi:hypothetical protein
MAASTNENKRLAGAIKQESLAAIYSLALQSRLSATHFKPGRVA